MRVNWPQVQQGEHGLKIGFFGDPNGAESNILKLCGSHRADTAGDQVGALGLYFGALDGFRKHAAVFRREHKHRIDPALPESSDGFRLRLNAWHLLVQLAAPDLETGFGEFTVEFLPAVLACGVQQCAHPGCQHLANRCHEHCGIAVGARHPEESRGTGGGRCVRADGKNGNVSLPANTRERTNAVAARCKDGLDSIELRLRSVEGANFGQRRDERVVTARGELSRCSSRIV